MGIEASVVGQAGGMLLTKTALVTGLVAGLSEALAPWGPTEAVPSTASGQPLRG